MTNQKLTKYLEKIESKTTLNPTAQQTKTPKVISDGKGRYLKEQVQLPADNQIKLFCVGGRTTLNVLKWLQQNLDRTVEQYNNIQFYIWLGTCDLTIYDKPFIHLASESDDCYHHIYNRHLPPVQIVELITHHPGCSLTFLETPIYSIYEYNKTKGKTDVKFKHQDNILLEQIQQLNSITRELNNSLNSTSPCFSVDLSRPHWKNSKTKQSLRDQYNYNLMKDGLHPDTNLSKVWLKKLSLQMLRDCWEDWQ